jgi:hypothetical protein
VRDGAAEAFMRCFMERWQGEDLAAAWTALDVCRRASLHGASGVRHPALWAGYALMLGALP